MRSLKPFAATEGSRLAEYAARMSEALVRRRAEIAVRAARVEAELAIKARSEFLANMNHELRTPLNAIIGFATMLRDSDTYQVGAEQRTSYAEYILQSADLLLGHINTLLEIAALESGQVEPQSGVIDLGAVLEAAIKRAAVRADAAGVSILREDGDELALGWGDAERFAQAVDHLLQVAIKLSDKGGTVNVSAAMNGHGWAEIAVRDEGEGFSDEELADALDVFDEVHRGLDRSFMGPGVGYAVAKTFIEIQGGRFSIESREGEGTVARVSLPPPPAGAVYGEEETEEDDPGMERNHDAA